MSSARSGKSAKKVPAGQPDHPSPAQHPAVKKAEQVFSAYKNIIAFIGVFIALVTLVLQFSSPTSTSVGDAAAETPAAPASAANPSSLELGVVDSAECPPGNGARGICSAFASPGLTGQEAPLIKDAHPGDELLLFVWVFSDQSKPDPGVVVSVQLPQLLAYSINSSYMAQSGGEWRHLTDGVTGPGARITTPERGYTTVAIRIRVAGDEAFECGESRLVAGVRASMAGADYDASVLIDITRTCATA